MRWGKTVSTKRVVPLLCPVVPLVCPIASLKSILSSRDFPRLPGYSHEPPLFPTSRALYAR